MNCKHERQEKVTPFELHPTKYGIIVWTIPYNECLDCHKHLPILECTEEETQTERGGDVMIVEILVFPTIETMISGVYYVEVSKRLVTLVYKDLTRESAARKKVEALQVDWNSLFSIREKVQEIARKGGI